MKLEFLPEGFPDCPLIRLYNFGFDEAQLLLQSVLSLAGKSADAVALHVQSGIQPIAGCELMLRCAPGSVGVRELGPLKFEWVSTDGGWLDVAGLIRPFCDTDAAGHQWLTRVGRISVLLSRDGRW